jgi:hypothetical protein
MVSKGGPASWEHHLLHSILEDNSFSSKLVYQYCFSSNWGSSVFFLDCIFLRSGTTIFHIYSGWYNSAAADFYNGPDHGGDRGSLGGLCFAQCTAGFAEEQTEGKVRLTLWPTGVLG